MEEERTPNHHPLSRYTDKGLKGRMKFWWTSGRGYRDVWMIIITIVVLIAAKLNLDNSDRTKELATQTTVLSAKSVALSAEAKRLSAAIQKSRIEYFLRNCQQQNERRKNAIKTLDKLISQGPPPADQERADRGRVVTVALIVKLFPKQNCKKTVEKVIKVNP